MNEGISIALSGLWFWVAVVPQGSAFGCTLGYYDSPPFGGLNDNAKRLKPQGCAFGCTLGYYQSPPFGGLTTTPNG